MKIVEFKAANVKRLTAVQITPEGHIVELRGANAVGKSSIIEVIAMVLGGKTLCPDVPIHRGADRGEATVDLGDLKVTRVWTAKGTHLTVRNKDGARFDSPQAMLDKLVGSLTFDPLNFTRMKSEKQRAVLLDLLGLADQMAASLSAEKLQMDGRKEVAAAVKRIKAQIEGVDVPDDTPDEEVNVVALSTDLRAAESEIEDHMVEERGLTELSRTIEVSAGGIIEKADYLRVVKADLAATIKRENARVEEIEANIVGNQAALTNQETEYKTRRAIFDQFERPATAPLEEKLGSANAVNAAVGRKAERAKLAMDLASSEVVLKQAEASVTKVRDDRQALLVGADFPVPGLGFDENGVTYKGLPFDQASQAERLRISTAVGMKANPDLRILGIRDGSLLDDQSRATLYELVKENDFQLWIEIVGTDGSPTEVVIEDGHVAGSTDVACGSCSKIIRMEDAQIDQDDADNPATFKCASCVDAERSNAAAQDETPPDAAQADHDVTEAGLDMT